MNENEVLFEISHIVNKNLSFRAAVEQIALLLAHEASGKGIVVEEAGSRDAVKLLESFDQPYRSLYSVDLRDGGESLGRATLCFASGHFQGTLPRRLAEFAGQQLGMLLARTRLAERRAQWRREIEKMKKDLASRKVIQRAEGILVATRGLPLAAASGWIEEQSRKTGLSKQDVADRIIAYHLATGLLATELMEQRIA